MAERDIILNIISRSRGDGAKKAKKDLADYEKQAKSAAVAVAGLAAAGKIIFDLGRQGAEVRQTAESFGFLAEKLNLPVDLLEQLRVQARGTIPDLQLMQSTATLLAGTSDELGNALGTATPQLLEIAKAAQKLNPSLGDTDFLYQSIARGIKRSSPLILDNLGIVVKVGEANEAYAAQLGKTVAQLTAEEKQMALLNAVLESGESLIAQVGGNTESATDVFDRFTTTLRNQTDEWKALLSEGIRPVLEEANETSDAIGLAEELMDKGVLTGEEYTEMYRQLRHRMLSAEEALELLSERKQENIEVLQEITAATESFDKALRGVSGSLGDIELDDASQGVEALKDLMSVEITDDFVKASESLAELNAKAAELRGEIAEYNTAELITPEQLNQATLLRQEIESITDEIEMLEERAFLGGDQRQELEELTENLAEAESKLQDFNNLAYLSPDQQEQLQGLQTELANVEGQIDNINAAWDRQTKQFLFGMAEQRLGIDGFTSEELNALARLAGPEGFGLIDEAGSAFLTFVNDSASELDEAGDQSQEWADNLVAVQSALATLPERGGDALQYAQDLADAVNQASGTHLINFIVNTTGEFGGGGGGARGAVAAQTGFSGVVPPGHPKDGSFFFTARSGEHVRVSPGGDPNEGVGGMTADTTQALLRIENLLEELVQQGARPGTRG